MFTSAYSQTKIETDFSKHSCARVKVSPLLAQLNNRSLRVYPSELKYLR